MGQRKLASGSAFARWLGMRTITEDGRATATVTLGDLQEGPSRHAHGGVLMSIIDEVMGIAIWSTGRRALAVNLSFDLKRAVPLGVELMVEGLIETTDGRKTFTRGKLTLPDGTVAVEGRAIWVNAPPEIVGDHYFQFTDVED